MDVTKQSRPFAELAELQTLADLCTSVGQPLVSTDPLATALAAQRAHCLALSAAKTAQADDQARRAAFALRAFLAAEQAELASVGHPGATRHVGGQSGDLALTARDGRRWRLELKTSATASGGTDRNWGQRSLQPWLTHFDCAAEHAALRAHTLAALDLPATTDLATAQQYLAASPRATAIAKQLAQPVLERLAADLLATAQQQGDPEAWVARLWRDLHPHASADPLLWVVVSARNVTITPAPAPTPPPATRLEAARTGGAAALELVTYTQGRRMVQYRLVFSQTRGLGVSPFCMRLFRGTQPMPPGPGPQRGGGR